MMTREGWHVGSPIDCGTVNADRHLMGARIMLACLCASVCLLLYGILAAPTAGGDGSGARVGDILAPGSSEKEGRVK